MIGTSHRGLGHRHAPCVPLSIGLVNNSSDRALKATEAQFLRMLRAASAGFDLSLKLFTCPEIPRSIPTLDCDGTPYADIEDLFEVPLDALIVTGMEPQGKTLQDEPVWDNMVRLVEWAEDNSVPVIWSCLAAHAAVLYLDGIARSRLQEKLSGVFVCDLQTTDHMLTSGLPSRWASPHSRYHELSEATLVANGYQILSRSVEAGVDVFLKEHRAPFLFFQGHPEYEADTVLRQYKRDIRRYLVRESDEYPLAPKNYFDPVTEAALAEARERVLRNHRGMQDFEAVMSLLTNAASDKLWEQAAVGLYTNWLTLVARGGGRPGRGKQWVTEAPLQPHDGGAGLSQ